MFDFNSKEHHLPISSKICLQNWFYKDGVNSGAREKTGHIFGIKLQENLFGRSPLINHR